MDEDQVSKYLSEIGRKGGHARAKRLTPEVRKEIAKKAGTASARVRQKKAKNRKPRQ
jgi:general stress protein YciG